MAKPKGSLHKTKEPENAFEKKLLKHFKPDNRKHRLVYIEWEDAVAAGGQWFSEGDAAKWHNDTSMTVSEIGWILEQNASYICLYSRISRWGKEEDEYEVGHLQKIPKTWIRKMKDIKI